jgi:twitching motility protein PilT
MNLDDQTNLASQVTLPDLLRRMTDLGGSDLHLSTNSPPQVRVHGHLSPLDGFAAMTPAETKQLAYSVLTDAQKHRFEENLELDFSFGLKGMSRFRANLFNQKGAVGAVFRAIPYEIKTFEALGLPTIISDLCKKPRGLILVTGPNGSGKSTITKTASSISAKSLPIHTVLGRRSELL